MNISATDKRNVAWIAAFAAISWLGEFVHNRIELPGLTFFSPENSLTALVTATLVLLWLFLSPRKIIGVLLLALGLLHLIGGAMISVIPFKFLPFYPEQSVTHYLSHILYGFAQLPLIIIMVVELRRAPHIR